MIRKVVNQGAAPLAFWQQLSEKDYAVLNATPEYRGLDYLGKSFPGLTQLESKIT